MIEVKNNSFRFAKYKVTFKDEDVTRINYSSDRKQYENLVARWGHLTDLKFETVVPTLEQENRLDTVNNIEDGTKLQYPFEVNQFVQYNAVHPETDAEFLKVFITEETENNALKVLKTELKDAVRQIRWEVETSGVSVNGMDLRTDSNSQSRIGNLVTGVLADETSQEFDFESQPGVWTTVSRETAIAIGKAVSKHVQACFTRCKEIHQQIDSATFETLDSVDITSGWPS